METLTINDIEKIISKDESRTLELRTSTSEIDKAITTACAFLNSDGGWLIFGVTPKLKIVGQNVTDNTKQEIAKYLKRIEPAIDVAVQYIALPDKPDFYGLTGANLRGRVSQLPSALVVLEADGGVHTPIQLVVHLPALRSRHLRVDAPFCAIVEEVRARQRCDTDVGKGRGTLAFQLGVYGTVEHLLVLLAAKNLLCHVEVHAPELPHEREDVATLTSPIVIP